MYSTTHGILTAPAPQGNRITSQCRGPKHLQLCPQSPRIDTQDSEHSTCNHRLIPQPADTLIMQMSACVARTHIRTSGANSLLTGRPTAHSHASQHASQSTDTARSPQARPVMRRVMTQCQAMPHTALSTAPRTRSSHSTVVPQRQVLTPTEPR